MSSILRKMTHKNPEKKFIYKVIFVLLVILIPGGRSNDGEKGALQTSDGESLESRQEDLDVNKIINGALVAINLAMALAAVAASIQGNMTTTTTTPRTHREVTGGHRRTTPRHRPIVAHLDTDARYLFVEPVTQLGKYPWVTRLTCHNMFAGSTTCFGVLVSRNAVLTSAQTLIGGTTEHPRHGSQEVSRHVVPQEIVVHSKFDELTLANDVALVKLGDPLNHEPTIVLDNYSDQNLKLLPSDSADGKLAMLAWGTGNYGSNYLKTSQTGLIDADKCVEKLKEESTGGPLIEENGSETALVSIHSYTAVGNHSENNIRYDGGHRDNCLLAGSWLLRGTGQTRKTGELPAGDAIKGPFRVSGTAETPTTTVAWNGEKPDGSDSYAWLAATTCFFRNNAEKFCSGALLSKSIVLNSAFCVSQGPSFEVMQKIVKTYGCEVWLGVKNFSEPSKDVIIRTVEPDNILIHPDYDPRKLMNDFALMLLSAPVSLEDSNLTTIQLFNPELEGEPYQFEIVGYGVLTFAEANSDFEVMQKIVKTYGCEVWLGVKNFSEPSKDVIIRTVEPDNILIHPDYDPRKLMNDFALMLLSAPVSLEDSNLTTIQLFNPELEGEPYQFEIVGYGVLTFAEANSGVQPYLVTMITSSDYQGNCLSQWRCVNKQTIFNSKEHSCLLSVGTGEPVSCPGDLKGVILSGSGPGATLFGFNAPVLGMTQILTCPVFANPAGSSSGDSTGNAKARDFIPFLRYLFAPMTDFMNDNGSGPLTQAQEKRSGDDHAALTVLSYPLITVMELSLVKRKLAASFLRTLLRPLENWKSLRRFNAPLSVGSKNFHHASVISPYEVTKILQAHEKAFHVGSDDVSVIQSFEMNQLPSNDPIEDYHLHAKCLLTPGMLFGIFDGHGGNACARFIAKRLYTYIATALLPYEVLESKARSLVMNCDRELLHFYNACDRPTEDLTRNKFFRANYYSFIQELLKSDHHEKDHHEKVEDALTKAFMWADEGLSKELIDRGRLEGGLRSSIPLSVALSGCVACVAHVEGPHIHVANSGDCSAYLAVEYSSGQGLRWIPRKLTRDHTCDNASEVERIYSEHPESETDNVLRNDRLLGELMPLRAFGDFRFKWSHETLVEVLQPGCGGLVIPPAYITPPYLTCRPEIFYHRLSPEDSFFVMGSDGLWELVSPSDVVRWVGSHRYSPVVSRQPESMEILDSEGNTMYLSKPGEVVDANGSTHLIRSALGKTDGGIDHLRLAESLTLPQETVRLFRDDITVVIVYFDPAYLDCADWY
ncbi:unnamed protein product [Notodromas monacha]|uniref:PPM-type phosphatase domain-containing protein n=1 Tax=Notodromas monacha TaxID=399045 RepID=A0A7R9BSI2_9CRUS|nr:unnamed protein product [Notodromas monacha]CAG0920902.1 unnamed protein product [Notodromas monacha]